MERRFPMKVSKRVDTIIEVELDSEAAAQLRWVFERSNGGHYHESLAPLAKALGVGVRTHEARPIISMTGVSGDE